MIESNAITAFSGFIVCVAAALTAHALMIQAARGTLPDLLWQCGLGVSERLGVIMNARYIVIAIGIATITASYWLAADPPNPWFLAIAAAALLVSIGITIAKQRAGHSRKN
jgi:4-amino-4-deoxy-L-arabinose transferase-like glycosyltransferase